MSTGLAADRDAAARGAVYGLLTALFAEPDDEVHATLADGRLREELERLLDDTALSVDVPPLTTEEDAAELRARFNDLFVVGYGEAADRTDGTVRSQGPPVSPYESSYRSADWNDVNLDLARAYDYYGLEVDQDRREHHDHLRLQLEFAGYLARREAAMEDGAAAARLDFLERHLSVLADGVADALAAEPGTDVYGDAGDLLAAFVAADRADLDARLDGDRPGEDDPP